MNPDARIAVHRVHGSEFLKASEAARLAGMPREVFLGQFPHYHMPGVRGPRCLRDDVKAFLANGLPVVRERSWCRQHTANGVAEVVYFIGMAMPDESRGPIKIGTTCGSVLSRRDDLQVGNPYRLDVLAAVSGSRRLETALHGRFAQHRMRGEWFKPASELLEFISAMRMEAQ